VLAQEYRKHLSLVEKLVAVRNVGGELLAQGRVLGVDDDGCLLLAQPEQPAQIQKVAAGELTLREPT